MAGTERQYNPKELEAKWQKRWLEEKIYEPDLDGASKKDGASHRPFYNLWMFPYPSAEGLHIGGARTFVGVDIYGRYKRMAGFDVFQPVGLDGFGIHSENYALKIGKHPIQHAADSEKNFYRQMAMLGNGYAWDEKVETYDPEYYRWTQWIFVQLWKRGLAYRKKQMVNWCPKDLTVLADEQVEGGKCERCGSVVEKKELEQWFFRITNYADRLLANIDGLDWSENVKIAQRNWIGKSEGAEIKFLLNFKKNPADNYRRGPDGEPAALTIFTTRPDTLYGATYLVLSPEHLWVTLATDDQHDVLLNKDEVKAYVETARVKSEEERIAEGGASGTDGAAGEGAGKTGVELKGVVAINPATGEEIPIFVADYVLGSYGTGAIMAVPAHDERDFTFAKKFGLPIQQVVMPHLINPDTPPRPGKENTKRNIIYAFVKHPTENKFIALRHKKFPWLNPVTGGIEDGETPQVAAAREIKEETGYKNIRFVKEMPFAFFSEFYVAHKDLNRAVIAHALYFELDNLDQDPLSEEEAALHDVTWIDEKELDTLQPLVERPYILKWMREGEYPFVGEGVLTNSGKFDGMNSERAKWEIAKMVGGERKTQFRLRDWLISRQRYWGPPIPMIYCPSCAANGKCEQVAGPVNDKSGVRTDMPGWYAVPENELPVRLPNVENFRPTGTGVSPLAAVKEFYEVKCPGCGGSARRETDVSDTFLDSSWYFLRYPSARDSTAAWDPARTKRWLPVDSYIGGAEHAVLHLLYSRFITMVFHDAGLLDFEEPFTKFRAHGLITKDGAKMSKSKGNVVNPDDYFGEFGADAMRMHLAFMAPLEQGGDFQEGGILGTERFLKRVWKFVQTAGAADGDVAIDGTPGKKDVQENIAFRTLVHKTIKQVGESIDKLKLNTGVSGLMILLNGLEDAGAVSRENIEIFVKLLAPFAPYMAEELWRETLGHTTSIHREPWPQYDSAFIQDEKIRLVFQVNGKTRDAIEVDATITEETAKEAALANEKVRKAMGEGTAAGVAQPKKIIYVDRKLVNIVI